MSSTIMLAERPDRSGMGQPDLFPPVVVQGWRELHGILLLTPVCVCVKYHKIKCENFKIGAVFVLTSLMEKVEPELGIHGSFWLRCLIW